VKLQEGEESDVWMDEQKIEMETKSDLKLAKQMAQLLLAIDIKPLMTGFTKGQASLLISCAMRKSA
jgi:hypothetical protein